jgi:hypothetical protein
MPWDFMDTFAFPALSGLSFGLRSPVGARLADEGQHSLQRVRAHAEALSDLFVGQALLAGEELGVLSDCGPPRAAPQIAGLPALPPTDRRATRVVDLVGIPRQ